MSVYFVKTAKAINKAKKEKKANNSRWNNSTRILEFADEGGIKFGAKKLIYIYSYNFKIIDGLITNFHLRNQAMILVSAFCV